MGEDFSSQHTDRAPSRPVHNPDQRHLQEPLALLELEFHTGTHAQYQNTTSTVCAPTLQTDTRFGVALRLCIIVVSMPLSLYVCGHVWVYGVRVRVHIRPRACVHPPFPA